MCSAMTASVVRRWRGRGLIACAIPSKVALSTYRYRGRPDRPRDTRGVTSHPVEAAVVAELFALYREPGTSLTQLARHLDAHGVPTPSGTPRWSCPTIRGILRNPT